MKINEASIEAIVKLVTIDYGQLSILRIDGTMFKQTFILPLLILN